MRHPRLRETPLITLSSTAFSAPLTIDRLTSRLLQRGLLELICDNSRPFVSSGRDGRGRPWLAGGDPLSAGRCRFTFPPSRVSPPAVWLGFRDPASTVSQGSSSVFSCLADQPGSPATPLRMENQTSALAFCPANHHLARPLLIVLLCLTLSHLASRGITFHRVGRCLMRSTLVSVHSEFSARPGSSEPKWRGEEDEW